jgi:segregation and condensation protein A
MPSAQETIAQLIDLAQQGEINPWDVQVIEIIDRYLDELSLLPEPDLAESGQAFLWASMLVWFKAETINAATGDEMAPEAVPLEISDPELIALRQYSPQHLERHLRLRAVPQNLSRRPVTLADLITQLQIIADEIQAAPPKPKAARSPKPTLHSAIELAHQENLAETALQIETILIDWQRQHQDQVWISLAELVELWVAQWIGARPPSNGDRVAVFWTLLLLSSQSKVELDQHQLYEELQIRLL